MVLFVGGDQYSLESVDVDTFVHWIYSLDSIKDEVRAFKGRKVLVDSEDSLLYVHQGEMAVIDQHPNEGNIDKPTETRLPRLIGSDDATSCYILVLCSEKTCSIVHLDCEDRVVSFFDKFKKYEDEINDRTYTVHIVGGFPDNGGISETICRKILTILLSATYIVYNLGIFCAGDNNTCVLPCPSGTLSKMVKQPVVLGVLFDRSSKQLCPASITWEARGPISALRLSRLSHSSSFAEAIEVFDRQKGVLFVKSLTYVGDQSHYWQHLTLDSMRSTSTTPDQEPITFFEGQLAVNELIHRYPDPMKSWFNNGALQFKLKQSKKDEYHWLPCDDASQQACACTLTRVVPRTLPKSGWCTVK